MSIGKNVRLTHAFYVSYPIFAIVNTDLRHFPNRVTQLMSNLKPM